jgi:DNA repair protein RadC
MRRQERYQLAFDFNRPPEPLPFPCQARSADLTGLDAREENLGRFVWVVRDEIIVRAAVDAAQHLLAHVFTPFEAFDQEELWVLLLNTKNRITHETMVYRGTINSVHVRPVELFKEAVRVNAPAILLAHQHPSGDATPSPEDCYCTATAIQVGEILGISVLDHLVIGRNTWISMKERGLGFPA